MWLGEDMKNHEGHFDPYQIFTVLGRPANVIELLAAYPEIRQLLHDWTNHARVLQAEPDLAQRLSYVKSISDAYTFLFDRDPGALMSFALWRQDVFSCNTLEDLVVTPYLNSLP